MGLLTGLLALGVAQAAPPDRLLVVVSARPDDVAGGRYAHDNALRVAQTLGNLGRFVELDTRILRAPTPDRVIAALRGAHANDTVVFYFSGTTSDERLLLEGSALPIDAVQDVLASGSAPRRIGILDVVGDGAWAASAETPGLVLLSVTGDAALHESETVASSWFAHHWTTGLRGAADADADRFVSFAESTSYATSRLDGITVSLQGSPDDSELTAPYRGSHRLIVHWSEGPLELRRTDPARPITMLPWRPEPYTLALSAGEYALSAGGMSREVVLSTPGTTVFGGEDWDPPRPVDPDAGPPPGKRPRPVGDRELQAAVKAGWLPETLQPWKHPKKGDLRGRFRADGWILDNPQAHYLLRAFPGTRASLERFEDRRDAFQKVDRRARCGRDNQMLAGGPDALAGCTWFALKDETWHEARDAALRALDDLLDDFNQRTRSRE